HPAFLLLMLLGAGCLLFADRAALALLGFLYAGWLFYALEYDIGDVYFYFIPTFLILCAFFAAGLGTLLRGAEGLASRISRPARTVATVVLPVLVLAVPLVGLGQTYREVDLSEDYEGRKIIEVVESEVRPGAVVLQHRSPLLYMQQVEGRRTDLTLAASPFPTLDRKSLQNLDKPDKYLGRGETVYVLFPMDEAVVAWERDGLELTPVEDGMLYEVVRK
ncbi:MAG: hypothetical protein ACRDTR_08920, partial [Rubrobacter sp.]